MLSGLREAKRAAKAAYHEAKETVQLGVTRLKVQHEAATRYQTGAQEAPSHVQTEQSTAAGGGQRPIEVNGGVWAAHLGEGALPPAGRAVDSGQAVAGNASKVNGEDSARLREGALPPAGWDADLSQVEVQNSFEVTGEDWARLTQAWALDRCNGHLVVAMDRDQTLKHPMTASGGGAAFQTRLGPVRPGARCVLQAAGAVVEGHSFDRRLLVASVRRECAPGIQRSDSVATGGWCAGYIHQNGRTFPVAIKDVPLELSGAAKKEIYGNDMILNIEPPAFLPFHNFSEDAGAAIYIMYDAPPMTLQQSLSQRAMAYEEWVRPCSIQRPAQDERSASAML
jgi:hypothetical protein